MTDPIRFEVRGAPEPQGSKTAFVVGKPPRQRAVVVDKAPKDLRAWRNAVAVAAQPIAPSPVWVGPVGVRLTFRLPRPKSEPTHRGRGRLRVPIDTWPDRRPDVDKLARAVLDALTGIVFGDDSQVVVLVATKNWGDPGLTVEIWRVEYGSQMGGP